MAWRPPQVGSRAAWTRTFTAADVETFAQLSGDRNPLHFDGSFAVRREDGVEVLRGECLVYTMQPDAPCV